MARLVRREVASPAENATAGRPTECKMVLGAGGVLVRDDHRSEPRRRWRTEVRRYKCSGESRRVGPAAISEACCCGVSHLRRSHFYWNYFRSARWGVKSRLGQRWESDP